MPDAERVSRRSFLQALVTAAPAFRGHGQIKPPLAAPDMPLTLHNGASTRLLPLVAGHVTAVQLMFTACTTTCPMQAAIFERVQKMLPAMSARCIQLLSLSVDPANDNPKALSLWRRRFHAGNAWIAAAPGAADVLRLTTFFAQGDGSVDHSTQVQILDRHGMLVWRTFELPAAEEIGAILQKI